MLPLTSRLADDGIQVTDVPAELARRVRLLSTGHGRNSDAADALSVGIAAHTAIRLHTARIDEAIAALRTLTEHRACPGPHLHADRQPAACPGHQARARRSAA